MSVYGAVFGTVFGLVFDGSSGSFPSPYDVREGVSYGLGLVGTLTNPAQSDVRQGKQYGGDGNQYTGRLYIPPPCPETPPVELIDLGDPWKDVRAASEEFRINTFGTTMSFNGIEIPCTATSKENKQTLQRNDVMPERPVVFTITVANFSRLTGLTTRSIVSSLGFDFQVYAIQEDDADATVDIRCTLSLSKK